MKVFISHSSRDKWVARRISGDLHDRGIETFLDEKDIETGDSIDDAIHGHLKECDELLMLLSPTALRSNWVMLEIGGARALQKRLVPILLHVGANELPNPLNKGLARDLNDIEVYYEEVAARSRNGDTPVEDLPDLGGGEGATEEPPRRDFALGEWVQIPSEPQDAWATPAGQLVGWTSGMDKHLGKVGRVIQVDDDRTVKIDVDRKWWWAMDWLAPADPP